MADDRPNILFVFSDQHRAHAMGCAGNDDVRTPNLDRLGSDGTRFENAYATAPVCGPSRACLLSGQYPWTNGVTGNEMQLPTGVTSVAEVFRDAGYRTGYIGKWHLDGPGRDEFTPPGPRRQGFDDFWAAYNCSHEYMDAKYYLNDDPEPVEIEGYEPVKQTDLAIEVLAGDVGVEGPNDDRPFCLFVSYGPPHDPYSRLPEEYCDLYDPDEVELRPNVETTPPGHTVASNLARGVNTRNILQEPDEDVEPMTPPEIYAHYYAQVTALDEQIGRLAGALEEQDIADDTVFAYTSDHGDMLWSHGRVEKGVPFEESANVPFVVRWPEEIPAGRTSDEFVTTVDVAPTLLSLAGIAPPEEMQGTDLAPVFRGHPDTESPDAAYLFGPNTGFHESELRDDTTWRGVVTDRHTYARLPNGDPWLLFDTEADPYQFRNLVYDREYADVRDRLDARLDAFGSRVGDPFVEA